MMDWKDVSDWSDLPDVYVTQAQRADGMFWRIEACSVPMALAPEVRLIRADRVAAAIRDLSTRPDTTGPVIEAAKAVDAAVAEYFMHDALAGQMEVAARKAAVRGLMVRMGIYAQFNAALDEYDAEIREARHDR